MKKFKLFKEPAAISILVSIVLSLFIIYRNDIFHLFNPRPRPYQVIHLNDVEMEIGPTSTFKNKYSNVGDLLPIKISFPISFSKNGCEFLYGAAVARGFPHMKLPPEREGMRYLIKFKYDQKNSRCESKDLVFGANYLPKFLTLQFVRVSIDENYIFETPDRQSISVDMSVGGPKVSYRAEWKVLPELFPYAEPRRTPRNKKFSTNFKTGELNAIISPYDNLKSRLLSEFNARKKKWMKLKDLEDRTLERYLAYMQRSDRDIARSDEPDCQLIVCHRNTVGLNHQLASRRTDAPP